MDTAAEQGQASDGTGLIRSDSLLAPYADALRQRYEHCQATRHRIAQQRLPVSIATGHHYYGFNRGQHEGVPGLWYREWAPAANYLSLLGDFNRWDRGAHTLQRQTNGNWSLYHPNSLYADRLIHDSRVKVHVAGPNGYAMDRVPAYIRRVVQEKDTQAYIGRHWCPSQQYCWQYNAPILDSAPRIYEAHVGIAGEDGGIGTFAAFATDVLPRIANLVYNAVKMMAIQDHPYYASFGYHVSNLYAVCSRFGTPDELKGLIDTAHGMGLLVLMDLVHSHMVRNTHEGLNRFDGTTYQYFHAGERGQHAAWDSLCYDYSKPEVLQLLLSNVRFWLEEFHFDGLRFDGVTSMLYRDHGLGQKFETYSDYFGTNVDLDAYAYLTLANEIAHTARPGTITIAEDVSGMPGLAKPQTEGGLGFDYRLAMGIPDHWIELLKNQRDEQWSLGSLYKTLLHRRRDEKHIGYVESHDQSLVGDKTIAFWLMDKEMYEGMSTSSENLLIDRGIALHKLIRLLTFSLAGEGYLNFMGNEFGHPEWIDFPRGGNQYSYHYARRQWSLVDADFLRYKYLNRFDCAMQHLDRKYHLLPDPLIEQLMVHEDMRQLIYRRGQHVFAVNLHPNETFEKFRIPVPQQAQYHLILDSDDERFGGHGRINHETIFTWEDIAMYGHKQSIQIYLPTRTALVFSPSVEKPLARFHT